LTELNVAREVVLIGFSVIILTLAVLTIILASIGGRELVKRTLGSLDEKQTGLRLK
jgi:hypothetical protein